MGWMVANFLIIIKVKRRGIGLWAVQDYSGGAVSTHCET